MLESMRDRRPSLVSVASHVLDAIPQQTPVNNDAFGSQNRDKSPRTVWVNRYRALRNP